MFMSEERKLYKKYTNPALGIIDFCKQKFCRPLLCSQWTLYYTLCYEVGALHNYTLTTHLGHCTTPPGNCTTPRTLHNTLRILRNIPGTLRNTHGSLRNTSGSLLYNVQLGLNPVSLNEHKNKKKKSKQCSVRAESCKSERTQEQEEETCTKLKKAPPLREGPK